MCGIVGYIGPQPVLPILIEGLRKLEYRGYDSAGVAVVKGGVIEMRRSAGKLSKLEDVIRAEPIAGEYGLGHTRWATHGRPTEENAHPHRDCTGRIVVVHNGIIENYLDLKQELQREGHTFVTETDTEVVAHLVERENKPGVPLEDAVRLALPRMRGMYALVLLSADDTNKLVAARNGPPLVVGIGSGEYFVASDIPAILAHTRDVVFLGDGEMAVVTTAGVAVSTASVRPPPASRPSQPARKAEVAERRRRSRFSLMAASFSMGSGNSETVTSNRRAAPGNRSMRRPTRRSARASPRSARWGAWA
jgi:glucosamine--fructose-6-phosphate aminotransferase (isomerizing)